MDKWMNRWIIIIIILAILTSVWDIAVYGMETETEWKELERIEHIYE